MQKQKENSKDLSYYMGLPYTIKVAPHDDGDGLYYFAKIEELPGCHTDAPSAAEAVAELEEVKQLYLEVKLEIGGSIPEPGDQLSSGDLLLRMPKTLKQQLLDTAKQEGVSANQLVIISLAQALGVPGGNRGLHR